MKKVLVAIPVVAFSLSAAGVGLCRFGACPLEAHAHAAVPAGASLMPDEPISAMFLGCQRGCGSSSAQERAAARPQPASPGDVTFCPVSGAVFRIGEKTVRRTVGNQTLYFCCDMCAGYFDQHRDEVLSRRGLAPLS
jgi:hypothetical protein